MTALNPSQQIPTGATNGITTVEQLAAFSGLALAAMFPTTTAVEAQGFTERVAQANFFYIAATDTTRLIVRLSLPVSRDYLSGGLKSWKYVGEFGNIAIPPGFAP